MAKTHVLRYQRPEIARKRKNRKREKGKTERYTNAIRQPKYKGLQTQAYFREKITKDTSFKGNGKNTRLKISETRNCKKKEKQKNVLAVYVFGPRLETVSTVVVLTFFLLDHIPRPYFQNKHIRRNPKSSKVTQIALYVRVQPLSNQANVSNVFRPVFCEIVSTNKTSYTNRERYTLA